MEPEELALELSRLLTFGTPEEQEQARRIMVNLEQQEANEAALYRGNRTEFGAPTPVGTVFDTLARLGSKVTSVAKGIQEAFQTGERTRQFMGVGTPSDIASSLGRAARATKQFIDPEGAAQDLLRENAQAAAVADPLLGLPPSDVAPQITAQPSGQLQSLPPSDLNLQAAATIQGNDIIAQEAARQQLVAQQQQVAALQAQQIGSAVNQDELQRTSEMLRLLQVPQVNPNALNNAAAFSAAPAVTAQPGNLTSLLPVQQSIGAVDIPSLLPAAQTNINQRQRVGRVEQGLADQSIREQERALELAREAYIQSVANPIFRRRR